MFRSSRLLMLLLFAALGSSAIHAQNPDVKPPNKNRSAKYKSGIFRGSGNVIYSNSLASFIGGGQQNTVGLASFFTPWNAYNSVIAGGRQNTVLRDSAVIGGGNFNTNEATAGTIAGGQRNLVSAAYTAIGGGIYNTNIGYAGTIAGGYENLATAQFSAVGGGRANLASASNSVVAGGETNYAAGIGAAVAGGSLNEANGANSAIGGGFNNETTGSLATIPGGNGNSATNYSFAAGRYASAEHEGSFVWGSAPGIVFTATKSFAANTFTVRCHGGARFYTAAGTNTGPAIISGSGTWTSLSDRSAKENFKDVDTSVVLAKVVAMPIKTWNYKTQADSIRHIGPTAQDFKTAFGVGESETGITTVDADGVALAAIQGLVEELKERDYMIEELKAKSAELDELKAELRALRDEVRGSLPPAR